MSKTGFLTVPIFMIIFVALSRLTGFMNLGFTSTVFSIYAFSKSIPIKVHSTNSVFHIPMLTKVELSKVHSEKITVEKFCVAEIGAFKIYVCKLSVIHFTFDELRLMK